MENKLYMQRPLSQMKVLCYLGKVPSALLFQSKSTACLSDSTVVPRGAAAVTPLCNPVCAGSVWLCPLCTWSNKASNHSVISQTTNRSPCQTYMQIQIIILVSCVSWTSCFAHCHITYWHQLQENHFTKKIMCRNTENKGLTFHWYNKMLRNILWWLK